MDAKAIKEVLESKRDLINELLFTKKGSEEMVLQAIRHLSILREYMNITITYFNAFDKVEKDSEVYKVLVEFKKEFEPLAKKIIEELQI